MAKGAEFESKITAGFVGVPEGTPIATRRTLAALDKGGKADEVLAMVQDNPNFCIVVGPQITPDDSTRTISPSTILALGKVYDDALTAGGSVELSIKNGGKKVVLRKSK